MDDLIFKIRDKDNSLFVSCILLLILIGLELLSHILISPFNSSVITSPILEEVFKALTICISLPVTIIYFILFNLIEFFSNANYSYLAESFYIRSFVIFLHLFNTLILYFFYRFSKIIYGLFITISIHIVWNFIFFK